MRPVIWIFALLLGLGFSGAPFVASAQDENRKDQGHGYSIMKDEGVGKVVPKSEKSRVRRGSSSPSPVPLYQSPVTPLGVAPRTLETPTAAAPSSPSIIVPGISGSAGPAVTPPRPAGQSFHDRTINCVHSGTSAGVQPGQIGAFTQSCVNQ